jgi:hypothetical protein
MCRSRQNLLFDISFIINNATEREKNQFEEKFSEKIIRRIALIYHVLNYFHNMSLKIEINKVSR